MYGILYAHASRMGLVKVTKDYEIERKMRKIFVGGSVKFRENGMREQNEGFK